MTMDEQESGRRGVLSVSSPSSSFSFDEAPPWGVDTREGKPRSFARRHLEEEPLITARESEVGA